MSHSDSHGTEALAAELRRIIEQAEGLLGSAGIDGEHLGPLKDRVNDTISQARDKLADLEKEARVQGKRAAVATDTWVRTNPWTALAVGAGIGLIIGAVLMGTRPGASAGDDDFS